MNHTQLWAFLIVQAIADLVFAVKLVILDGKAHRHD